MELIEQLRRGADYGVVEPVAAAELVDERPILESWLRRGFTREICAAWGIEWDPQYNGMRLPVCQPDGTETALWRAPEGVQPKYRYPAGFNRVGNLYGLWRLSAGVRRVTLVEGPLDAIWAQEAGVPAVAILGSSLSEQQAALLAERQVRQVALCFDADEAGVRATKEAIKVLRRQGMWVYRTRLPRGKKDIQEVQLDRVKHVLETRIELCANGSGIVGQRMRRWL